MSSKAIKSTRSRPIIGWREWVGLPDFGITRLKAKIDTGARTSAIHAYRIRPFQRDGRAFVEFYLHPVQHRRQPEVACEAQVLDERWITSSNGKSEKRIIVKTRLTLAGATWPIELSLTNRDDMGFRMLLGRQALRRRFVVDPGSSYQLSQPGSSDGMTSESQPGKKIRTRNKRKLRFSPATPNSIRTGV